MADKFLFQAIVENNYESAEETAVLLAEQLGVDVDLYRMEEKPVRVVRTERRWAHEFTGVPPGSETRTARPTTPGLQAEFIKEETIGG